MVCNAAREARRPCRIGSVRFGPPTGRRLMSKHSKAEARRRLADEKSKRGDLQRRTRQLWRKERRRQRGAARACFWTWPWGHVWQVVGPSGYGRKQLVCKHCGKKRP